VNKNPDARNRLRPPIYKPYIIKNLLIQSTKISPYFRDQRESPVSLSYALTSSSPSNFSIINSFII